MKNLKAYELDLELLLDQWQTGVLGDGLDHISDFNLSLLRQKLTGLAENYFHVEDVETEHLFQKDSLGG